MRGCYFVLIALALLLSACEQSGITGLYSVPHESGIYNHEMNAVETFDTADELGIVELDNGDLQFAAHMVFYNGHTCSIDGVARKDGEGWLYTSTAEYDMNCSLRITRDDKSIKFSVDKDAACRRYCGMRGDLNRAEFPLSSKVRHDIQADKVRCIVYQYEECKKQAEPAE